MPFRILVLVCGTAATVLATLVYPFVGLLALEFLTFARPQDDRPNVVALHIPMIMVVALMVALLPRMGQYGGTLLASAKRIWIMFVLYLLLLASAAANGWTPLSQNRLYDFGTIVFLCLVTLTLVNSVKRLHFYIWGLLACGAYVAERVIRNPSHIFEHIGYQAFERMAIAKGQGGNFGNSNFLALLMVLTMSVALPLLGAYRKWWQRVVLLALIGSAGYVFFRANSRGASLGMATSLFCMWLMSRKKLRATVSVVMLLIIGAIAAPPAYWARLNSIVNYEQDASATTRLQLWDLALDLTTKNPILGVGPDNFALYSDSTPHDAYLQVASEVGVPAMLVYVSWLISGLWSAFRARQLSSSGKGDDPYLFAVSTGMFCCIVAIIVQGFTTGFAFREIVYGYVAFSFLAQRLAQNLQRSPEESTAEERANPRLLERAHVPVS